MRSKWLPCLTSTHNSVVLIHDTNTRQRNSRLNTTQHHTITHKLRFHSPLSYHLSCFQRSPTFFSSLTHTHRHSDMTDANNTFDTINAAAFAIASSAPHNRLSHPPTQVYIPFCFSRLLFLHFSYAFSFFFNDKLYFIIDSSLFRKEDIFLFFFLSPFCTSK